MSQGNGEGEAPEDELGNVSIFDIIILLVIIGGVCYFIWIKFLRKNTNEVRTLSLSIPKTGGPLSVSRSFLERARAGGQRVTVFYGSQTGTAESFASRLAKECKGLGLSAFIYDPEDCDEWDELAQFRDLAEDSGRVLALFCMATYGVGDPTDNSIELLDWLKNTDLDLSRLSFAVFGLGNKTYEHFNEIGKLFITSITTK